MLRLLYIDDNLLVTLEPVDNLELFCDPSVAPFTNMV